ncbi:ribonuclease PH [Fusobacterium necrophorum subsp. funduliforme 1_1_36S]|nr:ribonuclease PH [Fusobacterium necrophorum subsp. funduliforme 1_1_36S]
MIPRATGERTQREAAKGKLSGRTMEIQRLIGRALRSSVDLEKLGERTITLDCDVIQADGGTRTASITGSFIAMAIAVAKLLKEGILTESPVLSRVAAVSVGKHENSILLDLNYEEDSSAEVDMNVIQNDLGEYIEVQGTGEEATFCRKELNALLDMAEIGIHQLLEKQKKYWEKTMKLFLATGNKHKIEEIKAIFQENELEIYSILDGISIPEVVEDGKTFEENSQKRP